VRAALRRALAGLYLQDIEYRRRRLLARGQISWDLQGQCEGCAKCCEAPAIAVGKLVFFVPPLRAFFVWWQRVVNGFVATGRERRGYALLFSCTHFDTQTRRCRDYDNRPGICRDYPRMVLEDADPELFEGCGYRVVAKNGPQMIAALEERGVTGDQLVQIKRKLRLE
jgi:uncharacterized protein